MSAPAVPAKACELRLLDAEAVHIIGEVVAELHGPVLLFSAGKDSIVLLRLAGKAFRPPPQRTARPPAHDAAKLPSSRRPSPRRWPNTKNVTPKACTGVLAVASSRAHRCRRSRRTAREPGPGAGHHRCRYR
jgi:hypothetical protein